MHALNVCRERWVTDKCWGRIAQQDTRNLNSISELITTARGSTTAKAKMWCHADQVLNIWRQLWEAGTGGPGGECVQPCANHTRGCICKAVSSRLRSDWLSTTVHHLWDHTQRAVSSLGLSSTREPWKYWRDPCGGPSCSGSWSTWDTRKGQENLICLILKEIG